MSNSTTPPEYVVQPQSPPVAAGTSFDRMDADIKALQQQALATQAGIQQLKARPAADPWTAILSEVPAMPAIPAVDTTALGASLVLAAALVAAWWYMWQRPPALHAHGAPEYREVPDPHDAIGTLHEPQSKRPVARTFEPPQMVEPIATDLEPNEAQSLQTPPTSSVFSRLETPLGFDSEAAAGEVTRVRKSLAEKREARAQQLEHDEEPNIAPMPVTEKDPAIDWQAPSVSDPDAFMSIAAQPSPVFEPEPVFEPALAPSIEELTAEMGPELEPVQEPEQEPVPDQPLGPDLSVTLALAQESESLELWNEARELAQEVMESTDPQLQAQALALIQRVDAKLQEIDQNAQFLEVEL